MRPLSRESATLLQEENEGPKAKKKKKATMNADAEEAVGAEEDAEEVSAQATSTVGNQIPGITLNS